MYYQKRISEVMKACETSENGLSHEEIIKRHQQFGYNILDEKKKENPFMIFLKQFQDLLVIILIIAAIISGMSGQIESTIVIVSVIIVNAILGTIQTLKAEKSLDSLKKLSVPKAKVIREGTLQEVDSTELTIGDLVQIEAGDVISGDGRIIECSSLQINESALTGEVESVDKTTDVITGQVVVGDQKNMVFSSSLVTNGTGRYIVTHIGMQTEIGKIASMLNNAKERKTPLQKSLDDFSGKLSIGIFFISLIVLCLNLFLAKQSLIDSLMIAVALAVAAIPEALSSIVTIVLSMSTQKMVKENAIIKNLNSVESLGCVSVICSDKTGTLTQNKMTPQTIYFYNHLMKISELDNRHHDHSVLLKSCLLCNNAVINGEQRIGDPTELALIDLVHEYTKNDIEFKHTAVRTSELPFDSDRKLMSISSLNHIYTKGAPDVIIKRCSTILINGIKEPITKRHLDAIEKENQRCANNGLRVLGFAYKDYRGNQVTLEDEHDLTFIGLVSLMDPPRIESQDAVAKCKIAGIKPIMITGDHVVTARVIATQIGIYEDGDLSIEGYELDKMSEEELDEKLPHISVYARVAPEHKTRIVKAWQKRGDIVAMTGDGVNDAPALKQSDIGVAMGITGTEVSKDAASMILTDDNFSTIVKAVITGRNVYRNIKNSINYLLSGNFAGILCVFIASLLLLPTPFFPVHLLFMNLITDSLPAIAIGMETGKNGVLKEKPRSSSDSILNKQTVLQITFEGIIIAICTMCAYLFGLKQDPLVASTMAFATICLARLLHGFNCRSNLPLTKIGFYTNRSSIYAFLIGFSLLHVILFVPFMHSLFMIQTISITQLFVIYAFALIPTIIIQTKKYWSSVKINK
ncbi:cation-translocating P-type ATPase [Faecalibacillus intestinalis]|uniref:Cation-translocating P-type ATPase n=1 Tax=Faecalibacillus intestinalis TaxID=1982626 RepID=A0AAW4VL19_9FIRM|nr:cation-translocating P-type ATPase [Faecalibacillus intestinalis]MCB8562176.1 cation-translocating P-type ATPase [Faecalibacillus intestinalis]MCG4810201.1 cation-translocating P-type ATPase [Faecalibacillus intestinalis]MEE1445774.1 cation-translocating P-type ATPase [Faecalibacillus intestinalis]RHO32799.1 cation-translocating P-type ATPase [Coprobacillus sp. AM17-34]